MNRAAAPSAPSTPPPSSACRALEAEQPPDLNTLAEQAGMSRFHFHRVFKAATGVTPKAYATRCAPAARASSCAKAPASRTPCTTRASIPAGAFKPRPPCWA